MMQQRYRPLGASASSRESSAGPSDFHPARTPRRGREQATAPSVMKRRRQPMRHMCQIRQMCHMRHMCHRLDRRHRAAAHAERRPFGYHRHAIARVHACGSGCTTARMGGIGGFPFLAALPVFWSFPRMNKVSLGHSGLLLPPLCLGSMTFGEQVGEADAHAILSHSLARGVNFIDTAEMYSVPVRAETYGATETIIGRWLAK